MSPTEILKEEHQVIRKMLDILDAISVIIEKNGYVNREHLEQILDFIRTFADRCHHGKEEDLLFVALEEVGIPKEGGPVGVMLMEHNLGRNYVKGMAEALQSNDLKAFATNARGYVELLDQHIYKEDNILYVMADMHIPQDRQQELLEEFERVEKERIGAGKHEEYHALVHNLAKIYLGEGQ